MPKRKPVNPQQLTKNHPAAVRSRTSITPHTEMGLERIVFFSDAVIAIAITLLALEIRLPEEAIAPSELTARLLELYPSYLTFFISFFVIGMFWMSHHRMFEYIHSYDRGLIWINLVFLFLVAFIPFPTSVLGRFPAEVASVIFYAAVLICLSLARVWLWWYVYYRAHLIHPSTDPPRRAPRIGARPGDRRRLRGFNLDRLLKSHLGDVLLALTVPCRHPYPPYLEGQTGL